MACKQVFSTRLDNGSASANRYFGPMMGYQFDSSTPVGVPWQVTGTFRNVTITHPTAPGSGKSFVYTFVKNGVDTAIVITIANLATTGSDLVNTVSVAPNDVVYWKRVVSGTPTLSAPRMVAEFWGTGAGESGYGGMDALSPSTNIRTALFYQGQFNTGNGGVSNFEVVGAAGNVTSIAYKLGTAPGSGKSYLLRTYKNGTLQDGSGGTPDMRVTIQNSATTGSWTGTLVLAAGDYVYQESVPSGTPASTTIGVGVKFVATTDGESQAGALHFQNLATSGTRFVEPSQWSSAWSATETDMDAPGSVTPVVLRGLRVRLTTTVATGPVSFTLRVNGADSALTCTLTSGQQTGSDLTHSVALLSGQTWAMKYVATGSPGGASVVAFGMAMYAPYDITMAGTIAGGINTTARASRSMAIGLDGNTNVLTEEGKFKLFGNFDATGYLELQAMTQPLPGTGLRLFHDVADGDLKVIFPNGTVKTIETN